MRRNRQEVIAYLLKHITGTDGTYDWDDFTSIPISDHRLNSIRLRCIKLDDELPEEREAEIKKIIEELESELDNEM